MGHQLDEYYQDGQRPCVRGDHCAGRKTVLIDGEHVVVPAPTYAPYCLTDRSRIVGCLNDLPARYRQLGDRLGDRGQAAGIRVSGGGTTTPALPINLATEAFQASLVEVLVSWEERVRVQAGLWIPEGNRRASMAIQTACATLAGHVDVMLSLPPDGMARSTDLARWDHLPEGATGVVHPYAEWISYNVDYDGVHAGEEILSLHYRCLARLGLTPRHHDLLTACWDCELPRLRRWDGTAGLADHVVCRQCASEYLADRLARLMVEEENTLLRRAAKRAS